MTAKSLLQSNQLIHYLGEHGYDPEEAWTGMDNGEVMDFLADLGKRKQSFAPASPSYLVVGRQDIELMPWIAYYGTWDPILETGTRGQIVRLRGQVLLNFAKGTVEMKETGQKIALKSATDMSGDQPVTNRYRNLQGAHLVYFDERYYLLDDLVFQSTAMRLFTAPEDDPEVGEFYRLVYNDFPNIRIYEVR